MGATQEERGDQRGGEDRELQSRGCGLDNRNASPHERGDREGGGKLMGEDEQEAEIHRPRAKDFRSTIMVAEKCFGGCTSAQGGGIVHSIRRRLCCRRLTRETFEAFRTKIAGRFGDPNDGLLTRAGISDDVTGSSSTRGGLSIPNGDEHIAFVDGLVAALEIRIVPAICARSSGRAECVRKQRFDSTPFIRFEVGAKIVQRKRKEEQPGRVSVGHLFREECVCSARH